MRHSIHDDHYGICLLSIFCGDIASLPFRNIIQHMYQDNVLYVRIQDKLTFALKPKIGVRQGDNINPNFFKIFLNDLPDMFDKGDDQVQLDNNFIAVRR